MSTNCHFTATLSAHVRGSSLAAHWFKNFPVCLASVRSMAAFAAAAQSPFNIESEMHGCTGTGLLT